MSVNDIRPTATKELLEVQEGGTEFTTTYIIGNEDHTLGNALRHIIMRQSETDFCGYSVPHPYEPKMNVRIQTRGKTAAEVMMKSLQDLESACDVLNIEFDRAVDAFSRK